MVSWSVKVTTNVGMVWVEVFVMSLYLYRVTRTNVGKVTITSEYLVWADMERTVEVNLTVDVLVVVVKEVSRRIFLTVLTVVL